MDRELLELAAKACGLEEAKMRIEFNQWNPIEDDGDALRLAVHLNMNLDVVDASSGAQVLHVAWCSEPHHDDPLAATRRAIVRAAAEIGRSMK
jgi:hypothetical protein